MLKDIAVLPQDSRDAIDETLSHALQNALAETKRLLPRYFASISNIQSSSVRDAETGEPYVEVSFEVRGEVTEVQNSYDAFTDEWVKSSPLQLREQIRFVFALI